MVKGEGPVTVKHLPARTLAAVALACFIAPPAALSADPTGGRVRGEVTDASGGVLPGVTVVATAADGHLVDTAVTGGAGEYLLDGIPAGTVRLTFQLDGFASTAVAVSIEPGSEARVTQRLELAAIKEAVVVYGKAPVARPRPVRPPPPPPPAIVPVPEHDRDSICGPAKPMPADVLGTIKWRRDEAVGGLYAEGDELVVEGGTRTGLAAGRNLVVRRHFRADGADGRSATGEHSSGLVQIVSADEQMATAVVVYACDEMVPGDFLAPFAPEPPRTPEPSGTPMYDSAVRILFADAGAMMGVPRRLMVIDGGRDHGIRAGQRFTLFRRHGRDSRTPDVVGDAIVVAVRSDSATIRVERALNVIEAGDWAAPQRPSSLVEAIDNLHLTF